MMLRLLRPAFAAFLIITPMLIKLKPQPSQAYQNAPSAVLDGVGILGDSNLDEYQGSDHRGGLYYAHTFNMIELLVLLRGFNLGDWGNYPEPRRTGFEYNWARSGATSSTMVTSGQHLGLASQIDANEVTFVMIHIGSNDFSPYVGNAYQNACYMSDSELDQKVNNAINNVTLATNTILNAGPEGMIVTLFPHWDDVDPYVEIACPDPLRRQRIREATEAINSGILDLAQTDPPVIITDPGESVSQIFASLENGFLDVGGELIDFNHKGDEPHHAQLNDVSGHAGTVLSGLLANGMWLEHLNQNFNTNIPPLTDEEILQAAGISTAIQYHYIYLPNITNNQTLSSK